MPDEEIFDIRNRKLRPNGGRLQPNPLESAIAHLARNARTTGEEPFVLRRKAALIQREALLSWAEENRLILPEIRWSGRTTIGGSEHDIWEESGEIWKITRPDHFGWTVLPGADGCPKTAEATPLEYLERWSAANRLFGDSVQLRGISISDEGVQVVISQPFIVGVYPQPLEIREELGSRGFELICGFSVGCEQDSTFYNDSRRIALFDASCDNFILSHGKPLPVDVIALSVSGKLREILRGMHSFRS